MTVETLLASGTALVTLVSLVALVALVALGWRVASRRWQLPCPVWLGWLVDSRYMSAVAGSAMLLDRAAVGAGMRVLDAGCGPGRLTIPAADRVGRTGAVVALDLQEAMLERVRRQVATRGLPNVRTVRSPLEQGAVEAVVFDRALLVTVLGEVPDREGAMRALRDALAVGGIHSITEVLPDPHYQSRRMVRRLAESVGLRHVATFGTYWAFTMNFQRPAS